MHMMNKFSNLYNVFIKPSVADASKCVYMWSTAGHAKDFKNSSKVQLHYKAIRYNTFFIIAVLSPIQEKILANSQDPDETARMNRLIWFFAVCIITGWSA